MWRGRRVWNVLCMALRPDISYVPEPVSPAWQMCRAQEADVCKASSGDWQGRRMSEGGCMLGAPIS